MTLRVKSLAAFLGSTEKASARPKSGVPQQNGADLLAWQLKAAGGVLATFQREVQFHERRKWRLDLAYTLAMPPLAIEVDGGVFADGRHNRGNGIERDCEKYCHLAIAGWRLMRVTTGQVRAGLALAWIQQALT